MPKSNHVDERVVEMRIDNQNFESGANKTISTLEKLERALHLKGDSSGLDNLERSVNKFDASPMSASLEKVQASFTALEIAGMRVISNLTDSVYNFAANTVKQLTIAPVQEGYDKYQEKLSNVQTIMNATGLSMEEVNGYLNDLMWYSDETSFSFTEMTSALSTMTSTGGDIKKLIPLLMGVGNAVAYAGKGSGEFVRTIRNLSQSYSGGYLTLMDWRSLQLAGTNSKALQESLIRAGEEMGKIKKGAVNLSNFTETLKDKWADTAVMERAFGYFSAMSEKAKELVDAGEFDNATEAYEALASQFDEIQSKAALAAQQAKTFKEVIDAVKDAVSTGWMTTFETLFGDLEQAAGFWTEIYDRVYALFGLGGETRNGVLSYAFGGSSGERQIENMADGWAKLEEHIEASGHSMDDFRRAATKVFSSSNSAHLSTLIDRYGSIEEAFKEGAISADQFRQIMAELNGEAYQGAEDISTNAIAMGQSLDKLREVALGILRGDWDNGDERRRLLEEAGYDYELMQAMAGQLNNGWENMSDEQLISMMEAYYRYNNLADRLGADSFEEYLAMQASIAEEAQRERDEIDELYDSILGFTEAEETAVGHGEEFRKAILNILDAIVAVKEVFTGDGEGKTGAFENVFGSVEERGKRLGNLIHRFYELTTHIGFSTDALAGLQKVTETVLRVFRNFATIGKGALGILGSGIWEVFELLDDILSLIGRGEFSVGKFLDTFNEHLKNLIPSAEDVKSTFAGLKQKVKEWISGIDQDKVLAFWDDLLVRLKNLKNYVLGGQLFKDIKEYIPNLQSIGGLTERIGNYLQDTFPKITQRFEEWKNSTNLGTMIGGLFSDILKVFSSIGRWISNLKIDTDGLTDNVAQIVDTVGSVEIGNIFGDPAETRTKIQTFFDTIKTTISEQVKGMTLADWLNTIKTAIASYILARIAQVIKSVKRSTDSLGTVLDSVKRMFGGVEQMFRDIGSSFKADAIKKIAIAVGILAASLIALSFVPQDKLVNVAVTLALLLGLTALIAKRISGINKLTGDKISNTNNAKLGSNNRITVFSNLASALIGFGMVLTAIAGLLLIARHAKPELLVGVLAGVVILFSMMSWIVKSMSGLKFENGGAVVGSIMAMALALDLLIPIVLIFAMLPTGKAIQSGLAVAGLLVMLGVAADAFSGKDHNGKQMLAAAGSMMMMALALDMLIPAVIVFAALGNGTFAGIAGMVVSLFTLGVALAALSKIAMKMGDKGAQNLILIAGAMAILALAMDLMIPATIAFGAAVMGVLAVIPWDKLGEKLGGFWSAFGKVVAAIFGAAMIAVVIDAIGIGLALMGVGLMAAGVGATVLAVALVPLGAAIIKFLEGIQAIKDMPFGSIIWNLSRLAVAFGVFSLALVGIVWAIKKLTGGGLLGKLVSAIGSAGTTITSKITENMPKILDIFGTLLIMVSAHLLGMIPNFVELLVDAVVTLFSSLADSMEAHRAELTTSITQMVEVAFGILKDVLKGIFNSDELSFVEKALVGLGMFEVGNSVLHITDHLKGLLGVITGSGSKGGGGGLLAALGGGSGGKGGLIALLKELSGAGMGTQAALDGMYMGASNAAWGAAAATAGMAGLAAGAGVYAVSLWDSKLSADYTAKALDGLGSSAEDVTAKAAELANTWREGEAALYDYTGASTVSYQEGRYAANALATMLGVTTEALEAQMQATHGNIMETQAMVDYLNRQTEAEAESASRREESVRQMGEATARVNRDAVETHAAVEEQVEGTKNTFDDVKTKANEASEEITTAFDSSTVSIETLKTKADEYGLSWDALSEKLENYGLDLEGLKNIDLSDLSAALSTESGAIPAGTANGIEANSGLVSEAIAGMSSDGLAAFLSFFGIESPSKVMAAQAAYIPAGVAEGINQTSGIATDAIVNLVSKMLLAIRKIFNEYAPAAGENAVIGLVNGAYSKLQLAYDAGYETGMSFMKGYDKATKTKSPSREMMQRGAYAIAGLVKGINAEKSGVVKTGYGIGNALTEAVRKSMTQIALMANEDFNISPVISPVVDMSNIDYAAGLVNESFGKGTYTLSGQIGESVSRRLGQVNSVAANLQAAGSSTYSNDNYTFNIYAANGMNEEDIANAVMARMGNLRARRGVAFG